MSVPTAYLGVILIWSTTPLAIKWSGEGPGFLFGAAGRMVLGALLCLVIVRLLGLELPWHRRARRTYYAASVGIYGAMLCTYWGSQFIPSGWISVVFGLTPIVTSVMAALWLGERSLTPMRLGGMLLGMAGLAVVFGSGLALGPQAAYGIGAVVVAVLLHSASTVGIKRVGETLPALSVTAGGLLVAVPLYALTWLLADGAWPQHLPLRSVASIAYLALFGSVIGFFLYFYVLSRVTAAQSTLITLVAPVSALLLGSWLNAEPVSAFVWLGALCILAGLAFYQWGEAALSLIRGHETTVS